MLFQILYTYNFSLSLMKSPHPKQLQSISNKWLQDKNFLVKEKMTRKKAIQHFSFLYEIWKCFIQTVLFLIKSSSNNWNKFCT